MAEQKNNVRKKKKTKSNNSVKTVIITIMALLTVTIISIIALLVSSVFNRSASEKLNKSMYPLKYENYVEKYCDEFGVDKCLVYGVIKTESGFNPDAVSPVGAIGLMQLMPDTFTWIQNYRTEFMPDKIMDAEELYNPKLNIEYGVYLLRYLLDMYDGNTDLVICSYNAGNGNIDNWLSQGIISSDNVDPDNIPFDETANYLRKVSAAAEMYRELYFSDYVYTYSKLEWEKAQSDSFYESNSQTEAYETNSNNDYVNNIDDVNYSNNEYYEGNYYEDYGYDYNYYEE